MTPETVSPIASGGAAATVGSIAAAIERIAPLSLQESYDNAGLHFGSPDAAVRHVLVALDVTEDTIDEALQLAHGEGVMVVSHHPLIFRALRRITPADYVSRTLVAAIRGGVALYAAHTNLDNAAGGVNYRMADVLGLADVQPLASLPAERTRCLPPDVAARCGSGVVGTLSAAMAEGDFLQLVKGTFRCASVRCNSTGRTVQRVALCGGAGSSFIGDALRAGADAFLTGEVGYHPFFGHPDLLIVEAGHYETEQYTCHLLADILRQAFPALDIRITTRPANPVTTI